MSICITSSMLRLITCYMWHAENVILLLVQENWGVPGTLRIQVWHEFCRKWMAEKSSSDCKDSIHIVHVCKSVLCECETPTLTASSLYPPSTQRSWTCCWWLQVMGRTSLKNWYFGLPVSKQTHKSYMNWHNTFIVQHMIPTHTIVH